MVLAVTALSTFFLLAVSAFADVCTDSYIVHQVFASPSSEKTYTVSGSRVMTARRVQAGGGRTIITPSSDQTMISALPGTRTFTREATNDRRIMEAYVGFALRSRGWVYQPIEIILRQIVLRNDTIVAFGLRGRSVVRPKLRPHENTALLVEESAYDIPGGPSGVPGARNVQQMICSGENWRACAVSVSFSKSIDTLIVLYVGDGGVKLGPVHSKCGCRCRLVYSERYHFAPLLSRPGACWKSLSSEQFYKCAPTGPHWCTVDMQLRHYEDGGEVLEDNAVRCSAETAEIARYERSFAEEPEV